MKSSSFQPENFLILVVDDIPQNLKVVGSMLDGVGYATTFAAGGQQALERVTRACPDLILLDLMMPEIDGLEVCRRLKANPQLRDIPIIFLTASHEQEHLVSAFQLGAVDYITKPFRKLELLARVRTHLELKHTTDQLKCALAELERLAHVDPLTDILNRRSLFAAVEQEFNRASRYNAPFSLLMLDVDHFKQINDKYGHAVGDRALIALTKVVSDALRKVDVLGRYGGEEFVVMLPQTESQQALAVAHRIRLLVEAMAISMQEENQTRLDAEKLHITISVGVSTYRPGDTLVDKIFERADRALYCAKDAGRNTCRTCNEK
jgi:diguanylate cyclase (GGDEF)-like protein